MTKKKHNKKRNTMFLFEVLVKELAASFTSKDEGRRKTVSSIIKEFFMKESMLRKELEIFRAILTFDGSEREAEKILNELRFEHHSIDLEGLFKEQSNLIAKINKSLGRGAFSSFMPNYKTLATIAQLFDRKTPPKTRVLMEQQLSILMAGDKEKHKMEPVDNLVYRSFVEKYNEKYKSLDENQKAILHAYMISFRGNAIELKCRLNEEVGKLKKELDEIIAQEEYKQIKEKLEGVRERLQNLSKRPLDDEMITSVLRMRELVEEAKK